MFCLLWTLNLNSVTWCNGVILFTVLCVTILFTHLCCRFIYAIWSMQGQATYLPLTGLAKSDEQKNRFWLSIAGCCLTINKYFYFLFLLYLLPWVGWGGQFVSTIQTIDCGFSVLLYVPVELARPIHLTCSGCFWLVRNRILKNSRASEPIWYILEMNIWFHSISELAPGTRHNTWGVFRWVFASIILWHPVNIFVLLRLHSEMKFNVSMLE